MRVDMRIIAGEFLLTRAVVCSGHVGQELQTWPFCFELRLARRAHVREGEAEGVHYCLRSLGPAARAASAANICANVSRPP